MKMAINAFYTTRNILEWHVAVNAVLVASGCALLIARPYANPYDLPLELSVTLARGESAIKCPSPPNVLKDTYEHSCY